VGARRRERYIKRCIIGILGAAILLLASWKVIDLLPSRSGPFEEAIAAYDRHDYAAALQLLRPLAERGNVGAQYLIGFAYESGLGVSKDEIEAAKWYRRAADAGHDIAQWHMGDMHRDGRGLPRDLISAYMWFDLAAMRGHLGAATDRDRLAGSMSAAQIAEARELARKWKPNKGALAPAPRASAMKQQPFVPDKSLPVKPASDRVPDISELSPIPPKGPWTEYQVGPSIVIKCIYHQVADDYLDISNAMNRNGYISVQLDENPKNILVQMYGPYSFNHDMEKTFPVYSIKGKVSKTGTGATPTTISLGQKIPPYNERTWTVNFGNTGENVISMSLIKIDFYHSSASVEPSFYWKGNLEMQSGAKKYCYIDNFY
jgi:hypothetical protein